MVKGITPVADAADKLASFLNKGVMLPKALGGTVTSSADEKGRPDQISVNKLGPFANDEEAARTGEYAALNPANGAIPVAMENSADESSDDDPDLHALAVRAHNSALAIIDPSGLGPDVHEAIIQSESQGGEMTLRSAIPSSSFAAVLMPIQMYDLVRPDQIKDFKIRFVGSKTQ